MRTADVYTIVCKRCDERPMYSHKIEGRSKEQKNNYAEFHDVSDKSLDARTTKRRRRSVREEAGGEYESKGS